MDDLPNRPLRVFLCHASADKSAVRALYQHLIADGIDAWLDQEKILPGQNWQVEIPKAVRSSDVVVVCLSVNSVNKEGYVQKEIKFALDVADEKPEGTIFIIPSRLEDCEVPDRLSMYQWVDLLSDDGYSKLLRALSFRAEQIEAVLTPKRNVHFSLPKSTSLNPSLETTLPKEAKKGKFKISPKIITVILGSLLISTIAFLGIPWLVNIGGQIQFLRFTSAPAPPTITEDNISQLVMIKNLEKTVESVDSDVAFSPDGSLLAVGVCIKEMQETSWCIENEVHIWKVVEGTLVHKMSGPKDNEIFDIAFSSNQLAVLFHNYNTDSSTAQLWQVKDWQLGETFSSRDDYWSMIAFSPDGKRLIAGSGSGTMQVLQTSDESSKYEIMGEKGEYSYANGMAFSPDGEIIAKGHPPGIVRFYNSLDGGLLRELPGDGNVWALAFSPDGEFLAEALSNHVLLWRVKDDTQLFNVEGIREEDDIESTNNYVFPAVDSVAFSADGKLLASGCRDGTVKFWRVSDGTLLFTIDTFQRENYLTDIAFSPDGRLLAVKQHKLLQIWGITP